MKNICLLLISFFLLTSCNEVKESTVVEKSESLQKDNDFEMYKMTELALLMEQMYAYNIQLRSRIIDQDSLGDYPEAFDKIHTAEMTDPSENDVFFQEQAKLYISSQKAIYSDPNQAKENFNAMVQSCLNCHIKKCGGPIPRIKKLFIN